MLILIYLCICVVVVNTCEQHQTCKSCIRDSMQCVWCATETFNEPRCISEKSVSQNWCSNEIINPGSKITKIQDQESSSEEIFQIKPKKIEMTLRPGKSVYFDFSYTAAEHYPVDLYFLCDAFMTEALWDQHVETITQVIEWIQSITNNASIGFGTFTDKNMVPFTSIKNESLSYSFRNQFSLSRHREAFKKALKDVKMLNNIYSDYPNGGFDALAQVIACDEIGWRNISRKIVVFLSNSAYHAAGDGASAGLKNPYDGGCYLKNNKYSKELEMDYPSTSIINKLASERGLTIIFVIDATKSTYDPLKNVINGAHVIYATKTTTNRESVDSALKNIYENITKIINLKVNKNPKYANKMNIIFSPDCEKLTNENDECKVQQNMEKKIVGKITASEYFEADEVIADVSIVGIREKLTLDIKLTKECDCKTENDTLCNGGGVRRCGVCECNKDRSGVLCECHSNNINDKKDKTKCVTSNSTIECSGRGSCICGTCTCAEQRYGGRYCECDNESCPKDKNGQLCGHGSCQCGECICKAGWSQNTQRTCNCDTSKDRCQTGDAECSGNGKCDCNECKCSSAICEWDARSTQGPRCNPLPCQYCHGRQCLLLKPYALNRIERNTPCGERVNVSLVKELMNDTTWMLCSDVRSDVGCYTRFLYKYDSNEYGVHLIVQSEHNCAESAYIYGGTCLGGLILMGLITLMLWKVLTLHRDRKEYLRFVKQHQETINSSLPQFNPLFNSPNTTVTNPNFRKRSIFY